MATMQIRKDFSSQVHIIFFFRLHSYRKKSIPTPWKVIKNSYGEGVLKVKILETKYKAKLEFPGGDGGCKTKNLWGGVWIFSGAAHSRFWIPGVLFRLVDCSLVTQEHNSGSEINFFRQAPSGD